MIVKLDETIFLKEPNFQVGILYYNKIEVSSSPQMLKGRLQLFQEQLFFELEDKPVNSFEGIQEWRVLWKKLGADPNRYRPSMEAMYRRIAKQNYITPLHSAVDLNNFFSLRYEIPLGIYDLKQVTGDIYITIGNSEMAYFGLNGRENNLNGILTLQDETGAFGSPFVDSKRTAVTEDTTSALQVVFLRPSMPQEAATKLIESMGQMFTQVHGGDAESILLHHNQLEWRI